MTELNNYIRELSKRDEKTLSQKALKTSEEVGELAKAVLPYDSAPGTNHRFVNRESILEEVVDVYLSSISIAYSLDFTDEEIEDMITKKSLYWSSLQKAEERGKYPLPYEIHITVDCSNQVDDKGDELNGRVLFIDGFKSICNTLGVKPIFLELELQNGGVINDLMTSSKHFGTNQSAYIESQRISNYLKSLGYNVVREKIESVPWHPCAPSVESEIPDGKYFESHIGVTLVPEEKERLKKVVDSINSKSLNGVAKLSQNFFKKSKNGESFINMMTYRSSKDSCETFKKTVDFIKSELNKNEFNFEKVEVEFALYDTNVSHDKSWINK